MRRDENGELAPSAAEYDEPDANDDGAAEDGEADLLSAEESSLLSRARYAYQSSTDYLETSIRKQWEKNLYNFRSEHPPGSKYAKEAYKNRSRLFRPKTRSSVRAHEAAMAKAAFSTVDLISVTAENEGDPDQRLSAKINQYLLQYRLEKTIPWYLTLLGAYQDTHNMGVCISHQYWQYEKNTSIEAVLDEDGQPVVDEDGFGLGESVDEVIFDRPCVELLPPENVRFDGSASWVDPINDSPYVIELVPMYAGDVLQRMKTPAGGNSPEWKSYSLGEILSARRQNLDTTRQAREGGSRVDPNQEEDGNEYTIVWVHKNIFRKSGRDEIYFTLGTEYLLSHPVPLVELYPHLKGRHVRPYTLGTSTIEAHRNYPAGTNEMGQNLQSELNDVTNQRMDNVRLVLNKRYFFKRGKQIDLNALMRNVPGGGVAMPDPETDVKVVSTPDVTSSSYQEQDRLAVEYDELAGNFSQSSVQSNRKLNETVGGMEMMGNGANAIQELTMKTFVETWVQPVLRQLILMEQAYETDEVALAVAGDKAKLRQKFGIDEITDELLQRDLTVNVNIGMGAVDSGQKIERLVGGLNTVAGLPGAMERIKIDEVINETFGILGYRDGNRFFLSDEDLEEEAAENPAPEEVPDPAIQLKQMELQAQREIKQMELQEERYRNDKVFEASMAKLAADENITLTSLYEKLGLEREKEQNKRDIKAVESADKNNELQFKRETGRPGI